MSCKNDLFVDRRLSDEQLQVFQEQGHLALGRVLSDEGLARMREQCMDIWHAEKGQFDSENTWLQNSLLVDVHHRSSVVRQYYFRGPLVDVAEQLIGPSIKGATSQLTFKMRGNTTPFGWHQDNGYGELDPYNALTTLTALDDSDEENGCLWIIPGSHKQGQLDVGYTGDKKAALDSINLNVDERKAIPVPMRAGEAMIFHCWLLHKSEGNRSKDRDRRILFLRYADADAVEVGNDRMPRLGKLLRGQSRFSEVEAYESNLCEHEIEPK